MTETNLRIYIIQWGPYRGQRAIVCAKCWYAMLASEGVPVCSGNHDSIVPSSVNTSLIAVLRGIPTPMATIGTKYQEVLQRNGTARWLTAVTSE